MNIDANAASVDAAEIEKFTAMADAWWDPQGKFKPLHRINPLRLRFTIEQICQHFDRDPDSEQPLQGLRLVDVGCGGGLLCEPLKRLGADIVGIDAAAKNVEVAKIHAEQSRLDIEYQATTVEALGDAGEKFDAVIALEIIEHVTNPPEFLSALNKVRDPKGLILLSTFNRTMRSYALGIVAAEYVLGWLPKGTHEWSKFVKPEEVDRWIVAFDLERFETRGMTYNPLADQWSLTRDTAVNYIAAIKPKLVF